MAPDGSPEGWHVCPSFVDTMTHWPAPSHWLLTHELPALLHAVVPGRNVPRLEQHSLSGVHCEQASPTPSMFESIWSGLYTSGQLSHSFDTLSWSLSIAIVRLNTCEPLVGSAASVSAWHRRKSDVLVNAGVRRCVPVKLASSASSAHAVGCWIWQNVTLYGSPTTAVTQQPTPRRPLLLPCALNLPPCAAAAARDAIASIW